MHFIVALATALTLQHVNVVDVKGGTIARDRTVVVESATARTIDASGLYLIPGLWDMHAHLWDHDVTPALLLANGVTGIRDMGSEVAPTLALRKRIRDGATGPRIVTAGPILDGFREDDAPNRLMIKDVAGVAPALDSIRGVDFLKVYHFLSHDVYLAIAREAKRRGLPFAGHLPKDVTLAEAIEAGQNSIEHFYGVREAILAGEEAKVDDAIRISAAAGVWHTPTLAHYRSAAFRDTSASPFVPDAYEQYLTPSMRAFWDKYMPPRTIPDDQLGARREAFAKMQRATKRMHDGGVRLLAGSDHGIKYVYPGFGLHDELAQLVEAGLTPAQALQTATTNATQYLRAKYDNDFVLLRANPLENIRNTREIAAVIANGRYLDRAALDALLDVAARPNRHECFMLQPLDGSPAFVNDRAECAVRTAPASTFKIPHSLIALETGVITDPLLPVPWDGTKQNFPSWEREHSLDSAVKNSVIWFFRRTAGLIGRERMLQSLAKIGYSGDSFEGDITAFWINGDLTVSGEEQLRFLQKLVQYELPVERKDVDAVKAAFLMPPGKLTNASGVHDFALQWPQPLIVRAKTGNTTVREERVSWLIGHIESKGKQYVFVARVRGRGALPGTAGAALALRMLNARK
jgi:beta-lactamase class D/imidazolonepropionase-like amidohydrolase